MKTNFKKAIHRSTLPAALALSILIAPVNVSAQQIVNDPMNTAENVMNNASTLKQLIDSGKQLFELVDIGLKTFDILANAVKTLEVLQDDSATLGDKLTALSGFGSSTRSNLGDIGGLLTYEDTVDLARFDTYANTQPKYDNYQSEQPYFKAVPASYNYGAAINVSTSTRVPVLEQDRLLEKNILDSYKVKLEKLTSILQQNTNGLDELYSKLSGELTQQDRLQVIALASIKNSEIAFIQASISLMDLEFKRQDQVRKFNKRENFIKQQLDQTQ